MQVAGEHAEQYPVQVDFASANMAEDEYIIDVQVGQDFFLALSNKGKVYAWGDNYNHQLGDGSATYHSTPVPVNCPVCPQRQVGRTGFTIISIVAVTGSHFRFSYHDGNDAYEIRNASDVVEQGGKIYCCPSPSQHCQ